MEKITFAHIYTLGSTVSETNQYKHNHFPEMLTMYDSNFIEFKRMPLLDEFKEAEAYLQSFHATFGQKHVKFYFPENERLTKELENHIFSGGYDVGFMELYAIDPKQFPEARYDQEIEVEVVTEKNITTFLDLNYHQSLDFGKEFAVQKRKLIQRQFHEPTFLQLLAYYKGIPAGVVHVIISDDFAEIDNLMVEEAHQKKGIGRKLQQTIMEKCSDKTIILIADGEDTPKEMYKRQNYQYVGFKYEALEIYDK